MNQPIYDYPPTGEWPFYEAHTAVTPTLAYSAAPDIPEPVTPRSWRSVALGAAAVALTGLAVVFAVLTAQRSTTSPSATAPVLTPSSADETFLAALARTHLVLTDRSQFLAWGHGLCTRLRTEPPAQLATEVEGQFPQLFHGEGAVLVGGAQYSYCPTEV